MASLRPALVHPEAVLAIDGERLETLLVAVDAPSDVVALARDPLAIARALFVTCLDEGVAGALHEAAALGSERGKAALLEALVDLEACMDHEADELAPDLAALAATRAARGDATWQRAMERALVRLARVLPERVGYEMWARTELAASAQKLLRAVRVLSSTKLAPWVAEEIDGGLHAVVFWKEAPTASLRAQGTSMQRRVACRLRVDLVTLDPKEGRVSLLTEDPRRAPLLAKSLAGAGLADESTLVERPALTLHPLRSLGAEGMAKVELPPRVRSATVIACQTIEPEGARDESRGRDAIARAEAWLATHGGYIHRATFRFRLEGARAPVDAYVELPHRLGIADARWSREVRAALAALGVMSPGAVPDDITTLALGSRPDWRWREAVGAAGVARLKEAKLLVPVGRAKTPAVSREEMRAWGHTLRAFELRHALDEGKEYALADDPSFRARTVLAEDRRIFRLDLERLRKVLAEDLRLDEGADVGLPDGVLDLGVAPRARARVAYVVASVPEATRARLGSAIAKAVLPAHAVILVPRGHTLARELTVELELDEQLGLRSVRAKLDRVLDQLAEPSGASRSAGRGGARTRPEIVLSIPGTRSKQRTDVTINGDARGVQNGGFAILLAVVVAALRGKDPWVSHAADDAQGIYEALSRLGSALDGALPSGVRLVQATRVACRLDPAVKIGEVAWEALAKHPDPRIASLARVKRG
jgi:hypothetical protein